MRKGILKSGGIVAVLVFLSAAAAFAEPAEDIMVKAGESINGDRFAFAQVLRNGGTVKGDLIFLAQNVSSGGTIEGDAIGAGQSVDITGTVLGNVRTAGSTVTLSGNVRRNVNAFGKTVTLPQGSSIGGSLLAGGRDVNASGTVRGDTRIFAESITLGGEFFGNVTINSGFEKMEDDKGRHPVKTRLTVLPGTVVHGTLTFTGAESDIRKGARLAAYDWKKTAEKPAAWNAGETVWEIVRAVFMTIAFMLVGLLLFRLSPSLSVKIDEYSFQKPWNAVAWGLAVMFSTIGALVAFIILLALSILITPAFGLVFGLAVTGIYALLFLMSVIPAGMLAGRLIARNKSMTARLIIGLVVLNGVVLLLELAGNVPVAGHAFNVIAFVIRFCAVMVGTGALAHALKETMAAGSS